MPLLTIGHGPGGRESLAPRLHQAGIGLLVDIRRFPGSRTNPDVRRQALAEWLAAEGIGYRWEERLGGRRRLSPGTSSPDVWWRVDAFRAYAAHTRTEEFRAAIDEVLADASGQTVVLMCSESVWWRCHRRLVADVAVLGDGWTVQHLMPDGRAVAHRPAAGARLRADGSLVWDDMGQQPRSQPPAH